MIPTIDTGKSRRMAGRPSTGAGKQSAAGGGMDEPPTLSKNISSKTGGGLFGVQDDQTSSYNRIGSGGAERGSASKPGNSGLFG